jgi:hypothetical protein
VTVVAGWIPDEGRRSRKGRVVATVPPEPGAAQSEVLQTAGRSPASPNRKLWTTLALMALR